MTLSLVINPSSGGGRSLRLLPRLIAALKDVGIDAETHITKSPNHLRELVTQVGASPRDTVVAVGGDGTNMAVVDALISLHGANPLPTVGLIPLGRGNSFACDLDLRTLEEGVAALARRRVRAVDVARFSCEGLTGHFLNCLGLGFVTDAAGTAARVPFFGDLSYVAGVFHRVLEMRPHLVEIEVDDQRLKGNVCFLEVCNSKNTGGNMVIAPDAEINDGLLDIVWVSRLTRRSLLSTFPRIFKGTHGVNPAVKFLRGRKISIKASPAEDLLPDGDVLGTTPVAIEVLPSRVDYLW
ncbi:MAG: YegS/Rv2252/BmrU family lipid kinase [Thermoanaerobaculales bacterium]|nr:YegS/Rv2252/BmrU family lipid kinase [Thermoanaerobaculales bacterium]